MENLTDCQGIPYPIFTTTKVLSCKEISGAVPSGSVYQLKTEVTEKKENCPLPGQFYMLRAKTSGVLLARPISVFHCEKTPNGFELNFLILKKGKGTQELTSLEAGDRLQLLGPLGNIFPQPEKGTKVCIIGGGIGVAPVAGFAETLPDGSYDFIASFKSGKYALENVKPENLIITTDDGSEGIKGMVTAAVDAEKLKKGGYTSVYACGPTPMLKYIKKVSEEAGIQCWLSMETHMACGVGVCIGCTVPTTEGNKRCCKDGPVFDSRILIFSEQKPLPRKPPLKEEPDTSFMLRNVKFKNPLIGSSGTFGFGTEYRSVFDVNKLGGMSSKGCTIEPRQGNPGCRLWETPSGMLNSIGLQNPGIPHFIEHELKEMLKMEPVTIANLAGSTLESYLEGARLLDQTEVPVIELNISCPNIATGGAAFGMSCSGADEITKAVRAITQKPLIVKLTPQAPEFIDVALTCIKAGADGVTLVNSFQGVAIDIDTGRPVFHKIKAGFGGPAVRPIGVRLVWELYEAMEKLPEKYHVPIFALGGVSNWRDVVEYIMAGATAVEVGTMTFINPNTMLECIDGLRQFMKQKGYKTMDEFRGISHSLSAAI